ncbi:Protein of unknown function [Lactobacillus helveticus CIRM-BIA 104]|uniref:Uncharacterized protein n=1 Tax=Lactobacillus helveticus CIRM-BIA 104 TaxID=1226333 RepID=U6FBB2_LACHE|nr:Protein of unknown function [Lactobacillus helveticus CIRM-BIA 104]
MKWYFFLVVVLPSSGKWLKHLKDVLKNISKLYLTSYFGNYPT